MSSSELVMDEERLIHIKEVTQHYAVCSALLENLQSAHYSLFKAKQQVRQLPWMTRAIRQKLDENIKEQVDLLHMTTDYQVHLIKVLDNAQRELLIPVTYPQEIDLATDEDEELRDIRANVFPPSDWSATVLHTDHMLGRCPYVNQHWHQARQLSLDVAAYMSSYSTDDERLQSLAPETGSRFLMSVFLLFKTTRVKC